MPLLDHFQDPACRGRPWQSFYAAWAAGIMAWLNARLPSRYVATMHVRLGIATAAEVADFDRDFGPDEPVTVAVAGGVLPKYQSVSTTPAMPAVFPDDFEVSVHDRERDFKVVAVVELVSPGNKDRPETRRAFAVKCAAYLQRGIGLVTVDVVTARQFNLHNELVRLLGLAEPFLMPDDATLSAVAYRPARRGDVDQIDLWPVTLAVGGSLPVLPLALRGQRAVPLDLEETYAETRLRSRL